MPLQMFKEQKKKPQKIQNIIAIAAGKGGVGKSTVAANLALTLHSLGQKVGILDADIYGPSMRMMLPEEKPPTQQGQVLIPAVCYGEIRMLSMAYFKHEKEAAVVRAPIANGIVMQFIQNTQWGELDFLIIDFPPGTGDIQLTLSQHANLLGAIMVTTPQEVSVMDVNKAINLFDKVNIPILGVIENMSYYMDDSGQKKYLFGKEGGQKLAHAARIPFLGEIPIDPEISRSGDTGEPLITKETIGKQAFLGIAKKFLFQIEKIKGNQVENLQNFEMAWREM